MQNRENYSISRDNHNCKQKPVIQLYLKNRPATCMIENSHHSKNCAADSKPSNTINKIYIYILLGTS